MQGQAQRVRAWVTRKIEEMEGFKDEVVIDMICRRLADTSLDHTGLQAHLAILMHANTAEQLVAELRDFLRAEVGLPPSRPLAPTPADASEPRAEPPVLGNGVLHSDPSSAVRGEAVLPKASHPPARAKAAAELSSERTISSVAARAPSVAPAPPTLADANAVNGRAGVDASDELEEAELSASEVTWSASMYNSASCAIAGDGIEQIYLPTPISDPQMTEVEIRRLHEWLTEVAVELYGGEKDNLPDLVERTAAVLRNSQLTSSVFGSFERLLGQGMADNGAAEERTGGSIRFEMHSLPSSLRSLLDDESLAFLYELWQTLKRDEPQTAHELLHPDLEEGGAVELAEKPQAEGARAYSAEEDQLRARSVRAWVEAKVVELQGFSDKIVIDAVLRRLEGQLEASRDAIWKDKGGSLEAHLKLLMDENASIFVDELARFLNARRSTSHPATSPPPAVVRVNGKPTGGTVELPDDVRRWCEPELGVPRVLLVGEVGEGLLLVLQGPTHHGSALLLRTGSRRFTPLRAAPDGALSPLHAAWPAPNGALLRVGSGVTHLTWRAQKEVARLPAEATAVDATWEADGELTLVALVDPSARPHSAAVADEPVVWPPAPSSLELRRFTPLGGWVRICVLPHTSCSLALSAHGLCAAWCVRETDDGQATGVGEFHVIELAPGAKPAPVTEGAGTCGAALLAPDGSGVVYLANHAAESAVDDGSVEEMALWWSAFEGGFPPLQLSPPGMRILDFGWAPAVEEELEPEEPGEDEEEYDERPREPEYGVVLRLWVTVQRGLRAHTHLVDLHGNLIGSFELPVSGNAVTWLADGRRVLVTESAEWFPALWDGAALLSLPVPEGFSQIELSEESWCCSEGRKGSGVIYSMRGTPADAPIIVVFHPHAEGPLLAVRSHASAPPLPVHALLRCGFRVLKTSGDVEPGTVDSLAMLDALAVGDALAGVDHCLRLAGLPPGGAAVGVLGSGFGGHLAVQALVCSERFVAGASVGGFVDDAWRRLETGDVRRGSGAPLVQGDTLEHLDAITAPLLMLHGGLDKVSPPSHARVVYHHLHARSVPVQLVVYPDESHRLNSEHSRRNATQRICAWMLAHLGESAATSACCIGLALCPYELSGRATDRRIASRALD
ncbi:hypothetical protein AB1Y20_021220 [Prymnesium parvum]|uniref:PWI domain-containing protein n=1 Tax=Prymnesium parvum TaxID=97485 RepID=A0AB34JJI1_PRYPA